ncbi:N-formylglutamate amidohydrolase [Ruegeria sp. HKCCD8929]|uniref:N-formylglutamate amidohydrolase n=1 Tax=Ruegeria sp. HKCCD8929 TaxID=2683006 RepID=UPI001487A896|nr:N-formylglutamate amidohydrolase [Ruegeria sp. HKCCD8929]
MTAPVEVLNAAGRGRVVLLCEHASNRIPAEYDGLGLSEADRASHAAWDPGARTLTLRLSRALDAPVVASTVSRLVYDCNRPPEAASATPERSETIGVPGNVGLSQQARDARAAAIYAPFCKAVAQVLDARGPETVLVTVHSFTPVYFGQPRAVELGLLHDEDSRLVDAMLDHVDHVPHRHTERNEPYGPADGVTHSLRLHALGRGLANVMLEVRNDLLRTDKQVAAMAQDILALLDPALKEIAIKEEAS